jgi:hypothetical protein
MSQLSDELDPKNIDHELDGIAGSFLTKTVPQAFRHEMLLYYVGVWFLGRIDVHAAGVARYRRA